MVDLNTILAASVPTLAVIVAIIRNEAAINGQNTRIGALETSLSARIAALETSLSARISSLESRLDARIETLDRDLRDWSRIVMQHSTGLDS